MSGPQRVGSAAGRPCTPEHRRPAAVLALGSNTREHARQNVAAVLRATIPQPRTIAALQAAAQNDRFPHVASSLRESDDAQARWLGTQRPAPMSPIAGIAFFDGAITWLQPKSALGPIRRIP